MRSRDMFLPNRNLKTVNNILEPWISVLRLLHFFVFHLHVLKKIQCMLLPQTASPAVYPWLLMVDHLGPKTFSFLSSYFIIPTSLHQAIQQIIYRLTLIPTKFPSILSLELSYKILIFIAEPSTIMVIFKDYGWEF